MNSIKRRLAFNLSFIFILIVSAVYMFLAIAIVPYWQGLSGSEVQSWFAGPFRRFGTMMVPVHLLSILTTILAFVLLRCETDLRLLSLALVALLICQGLNFTLFATDLNPALQSGLLSDDGALAAFSRWAYWHNVRTAAVVVSAFAMFVIAVRAKES